MPIGMGGKLAEAYVQVRADQKTLRRDMAGIKGFFTGQVRSMQASLSGALSPLRGLLGIGAGIGGVVAIKRSIGLAMEQERVERKLAAVLRATGGAAGYSAKELNAFAAELQKVTNYGDEATIDMMAVLATFKEIRGPSFKEATRAIQDMSAVLGQDMRSAAIQVGKALNDPLVGVTALGRAGVTFSASQKQMIKSLVESNDLLGAQKIILAELKSEFGGAAEAMADPIIQFKNALGDLGESLGTIVLPYLRQMADLMKESADSASEMAKVGGGKGGGEGLVGTVADVMQTAGLGFKYGKAYFTRGLGTLTPGGAGADLRARGDQLLASAQESFLGKTPSERAAMMRRTMANAPTPRAPAVDWATQSGKNREAVMEYLKVLTEDTVVEWRKQSGRSGLVRRFGEVLGAGLSFATGPLAAIKQYGRAQAGLAAYNQAAGAGTVGRGGFTGISDLSRVIQSGIFGSYQDRMQQKQTAALEDIRKNMDKSVDVLNKILASGFGVFAVGAD